MAKMFLVFAVFAAIVSQVQAAEMLNLTRTSGTIATVDDSSFEKVWGGSKPACIKDGGSVLKVNQAYVSAGLKSRDCSASPAAIKKNELLGRSVTVFKVAELSPKYARQAMGLK